MAKTRMGQVHSADIDKPGSDSKFLVRLILNGTPPLDESSMLTS